MLGRLSSTRSNLSRNRSINVLASALCEVASLARRGDVCGDQIGPATEHTESNGLFHIDVCVSEGSFCVSVGMWHGN